MSNPSNQTIVEKLELALKMMKDRRHAVAGLGACISILNEVIASLKNE